MKGKVTSYSLQPSGPYSPWTSLGKNTGVGSLSLLQGIFPTQESNPGLPHCKWILYQLSHKGSPRILEWVAYLFSSGSSRPRNWTGVSCIAGSFSTSWATRESPREFLMARNWNSLSNKVNHDSIGLKNYSKHRVNISASILVNDWINSREGPVLTYRRILINRSRKNEGNRKLPLEHHSNNYSSQGPLMNARISQQKFRGEIECWCNLKISPPK